MSEFPAGISKWLLTQYMSHTAIGYEMGFAAITREDFKSEYGFFESLDRLVRRTVVFEMLDGHIPKDPNFELSPTYYAFGLITLARWLPICLIQLSGIHEPFVNWSVEENKVKQAIGKFGIITLGEGLYWLGYLCPCNDMNPALPVDLDENLTLAHQAKQRSNRSMWRNSSPAKTTA